MNGRKAKQLRRIGEQRLIDWLRTMVPEGEDISKINKNNLQEFLPEQTHVFANNRFLLSAYSLRWFYKQVKKNPNFKV
jgi:phage antirepressor YoqD-like protein